MAVASLHDVDRDRRTGNWWWSSAVSHAGRTAATTVSCWVEHGPARIHRIATDERDRGVLTDGDELSFTAVLKRARQRIREYRSADEVSIHRVTRAATIEHLTNGTLINGEALGTASTRSTGYTSVPVDPEPNAGPTRSSGGSTASSQTSTAEPGGSATTAHLSACVHPTVTSPTRHITLVSSTTAKADESFVSAAMASSTRQVRSLRRRVTRVELYVD